MSTHLQNDSTGGTISTAGETVRARAEVGGVGSSDDPVPDLWFGQNAGERSDATCSAGEKRREGRGDGLASAGLTALDKVRQLQITLYRGGAMGPAQWGLIFTFDILLSEG